MKRCNVIVVIGLFAAAAAGSFSHEVYGQTESTQWGNIRGIRVEGQMIRFSSSIRIVSPDWTAIARSANPQRGLSFARSGNRQTIRSSLDNVTFTEIIDDVASGIATIDINVRANSDAATGGTYFCIDLPDREFPGSDVQLMNAASSSGTVSLQPSGTNEQNEYARTTAQGVRFTSATRSFEITADDPTELVIRDDRRQRNRNIQVYLGLLPGDVMEGQTAHKTFTIKIAADIDKQPVHLSLDTSHPGRPFVGIGGNFRLQKPNTDPQVIDYCLENLDVNWGRICMRWNEWQPDEDMDPIAAAKNGNLRAPVRETMEMARRLAAMDMPVIASIWFPPDWAIYERPRVARQKGSPLNPEKMDKICKSIGDYLVYLKEAYGVEAALFSFNEAEKGINVFLSPEEHAALIKTLGQYLVSRGLSTKMLLGDIATASDYWFIQPAVDDPETYRYIGAAGFHTWGGCTDDNLAVWADTAQRLNVPLLVTEASPDGAAHQYPGLFLEPWFQLSEIDLYIRICNICQPLSIMQWQLTADYSILTGAGIFNTDGPLRPTQRFWNLKQLGTTPPGSFAMPITSDRPAISCAAFGDIARNRYSVHMVNNGATRAVTLTGLPEGVNEFRVYVTDNNRNMEESARIPVTGGTARFTLDATSYTSLFSGQ